MAPTGMEGFAQQAGALAGQAQGLRAAVDNGQLVMDPEAAERVAKVYDGKARELVRKITDAHGLIVDRGYGDCEIGRAVERKFNGKAQGGDASIVTILRDMQGTLKAMAQAYRDSARDMQNNDDENARNLRRNI